MRNPDLVKRLRWGSDKKKVRHATGSLSTSLLENTAAIMSQPYTNGIIFSALIIKWVCQERKLLPEVGRPTSTCPRRLWSSARSSGTMGRWKVLVTRQDRVRSPTNLGSGSSAGKTATLKTGHRISLLLNILFFTMNQSISVFIWRRRLLAASVADPAP